MKKMMNESEDLSFENEPKERAGLNKGQTSGPGLSF